MRRLIIVSFVWLAAMGGVHAQDNVTSDPIKEKLEAVRAACEAEIGKAKDALATALRQKEEAAQKAGDLDLLKRVRAEIVAFAQSGELPKAVSATDYLAAVKRVRGRLELALAQARKEYTQAGKIAEAEAINGELERLKQGKEQPAAPQKAPEPQAKYVYFVYGSGTFEKTRGPEWLCREPGPKIKFIFDEVERTAKYIELFDRPRNCRIRLFFNGSSDWSDNGRPWVPFNAGKWAE